MTDVFSASKRSAVMSRIRSRFNRTTELALAKSLRRHGVTGWRRHQTIMLPARRLEHTPKPVVPDFVFKASQVAVFVDGCFWHRCPKHFHAPQTNRQWWAKKIAANVCRDRFVDRALRRAGWMVIRVWEHDLKSCPEHVACRVRRCVNSAGARASLLRRLSNPEGRVLESCE